MIVFRYIIRIIFILCLSIMISSNVVQNVGRLDVQKTNKKSADNTDDKTSLAVLVYTVSLGLIGLFSIYNSLEIYKKKEQFDKDLSDLFQKHHQLVMEFENKTKVVESSYNSIKYQIQKYELSLIKKNRKMFDRVKKDIDDNAKNSIENIRNEYGDGLSRIDKKQKEINQVIEANYSDYKLFYEQTNNEMSRCYYIYVISLYSLVKDTQRANVISALNWFSQNGNDDDLELLYDFIDSNKSCAYPNVLLLCEQVVKEIINRCQVL